jgi:hypothetical protein
MRSGAGGLQIEEASLISQLLLLQVSQAADRAGRPTSTASQPAADSRHDRP